MPKRKNWNIAGEIASLKKNLSDPKQVEWFSTLPRREMESWLESASTDFFALTQFLSRYAGSLGAIGAVRIYDGDDTAWQLLSDSLAYRFWSARLRFALSDRSPGQVPFLTGIEPLVLAHAISVRQDAFARWLGTRGIQAYRTSDAKTIKRYQHFVTPINRFVLRLFSLWTQQDVDLGITQTVAEPLEALLGDWEKTSPSYDKRIDEACDYSNAQAGQDSSELGSIPYHVFPVVMLAVLRVRKDAGFPNQQANHPLLNSKLASIPSIWPVAASEDPLLGRIERRVRDTLPGFGTPY